MPELPDLEAYCAALVPRLEGDRLEAIRLFSPFVLRSVTPPLAEVHGREVRGVERLGKRIVLALEADRFLVVHLMVAGRFQWRAAKARPPGRIGLAAFDFERGSLLLTEASKRRRAWLRLVAGRAALAALDPGGVEPLAATDAELRSALARENRTLKRALTDPRLVAGIGNAYSDEILWSARLSPFARTATLDDASWRALLAAVRATLAEWRDRLVAEARERFPDKVTAFRPEMAVHGRFGQPCRRCGAAVQRVVYAENEANYCAVCQTGGRLLADRALSRLLHGDWPKSLDELEERKARVRAAGAPMRES
jgi:formamidopyrimidine-DNA glycosylase